MIEDNLAIDGAKIIKAVCEYNVQNDDGCKSCIYGKNGSCGIRETFPIYWDLDSFGKDKVNDRNY